MDSMLEGVYSSCSFWNIPADFSILLVVAGFTMNRPNGLKGQHKERGVNFDEAMEQAFGEIFENLKAIEADTKKQRDKLDLERRRESAPAAMLRETTAAFKHPKKILKETLSTPRASSSMSAIHQPVNRLPNAEKRAKRKSTREANRGGTGTEKVSLVSVPQTARSVRRAWLN
ncbi:hypothetical protein OS493_028833 [Desmophyllum pertusum]|uniref:Uncharacterized protein n=1 Tax=Desmophyllum pertusum TaxID=174260 RepID=A0A9X0D9H7_9CNID|nr:hypothetical protein OS493_028833 [Desmophyllum pertusum]